MSAPRRSSATATAPDAQAANGRPADLLARYRAVRAATDALAAPLTPEDCLAQSMPDASPVKWHLAHTTWFFETFVLERIGGERFTAFDPSFRVLYNSYYNTVGEQHPRPERGLVTRPGLERVHAYRRDVDARVERLLGNEPPGDAMNVVEVGLQHEQQHQELILTDVRHLLSRNPLYPPYHDADHDGDAVATERTPELRWHRFPEGTRWIGHDGVGFAFDNEWPRHRQFVHEFELASRLVTNAEFIAFIEDGGYERPELWLADGWAEVSAAQLRAPLYWVERDGRRHAFTLGGLRPLRPGAPACNVSYFEADAYARWAGCRLPTEAEWESASDGVPIEGNFVESGALTPIPAPVAGNVHPTQLHGDAWEWTSSPYTAYPGYEPLAGSLGEYNGKFMCNQFVLRGGSCATPRTHIRSTYRNFFPPRARWQFTGIRLARDV